MESTPASANGSRRNEDIALDLLKFVATTAHIAKPASGPTTGFGIPSGSKSGDDQVTQLLDLYRRCLDAVSDK